jgi:hypothetical protein
MMTVTDARLSAEDLSEICPAARRRRSEYLRSLVLGWLSCHARADSELLNSTPKPYAAPVLTSSTSNVHASLRARIVLKPTRGETV